jgi:hypothetical protein
MNKDGTIHREKGSKKHLFHIGMLDGKYTVLCMRPGDASTYQFCGFAEKLPFAEAPEEIRKFILESGKFKNIDRVEVENLALYTYPCNDEGTAYWVRVGKVLPDEEGED